MYYYDYREEKKEINWEKVPCHVRIFASRGSRNVGGVAAFASLSHFFVLSWFEILCNEVLISYPNVST